MDSLTDTIRRRYTHRATSSMSGLRSARWSGTSRRSRTRTASRRSATTSSRSQLFGTASSGGSTWHRRATSDVASPIMKQPSPNRAALEDPTYQRTKTGEQLVVRTRASVGGQRFTDENINVYKFVQYEDKSYRVCQVDPGRGVLSQW